MTPTPAYRVSVRIEVPATTVGTSEVVATAAATGARVTGLDVAAAEGDRLVVDLTCDTRNSIHRRELVDHLKHLPGVEVKSVGDATFLAHIGGKIATHSRTPLRNRDDLSRIYTPGVARVCQAIADSPSKARHLTIKKNTVAV
ncbi:MAG: NAD-dependent malic enzyme, partial [Bowdeniella nasicola]|nr:NAD-dependent malic enzyme [Bowdeniella nasicola]